MKYRWNKKKPLSNVTCFDATEGDISVHIVKLFHVFGGQVAVGNADDLDVLDCFAGCYDQRHLFSRATAFLLERRLVNYKREGREIDDFKIVSRYAQACYGLSESLLF